MADTLTVALRESFGTRAAERLRQSGQMPMVLYGHGQETVHLQVPVDQINAVIRHGGKLVELTGAVTDSAVIKDMQWGPLGAMVLHIDLTRVTAHEEVEVTVPIELRGVAPGTKEGGIVEHATHEVDIRCPARALPEKLQISINDLHLEQSLYASDLTLPDGATLVTAPETLIVHCVPAPVVEPEGAVPGEASEEPEIIRRPEEEEEGGEE